MPAQGQQEHRRHARLGGADARRHARAVVVAEHPVRPRALGQRGLVAVDQRAEVLGPPGRRDQVEVERQLRAAPALAVVAHEPLDRHVDLGDHQPVADHRAHLGHQVLQLVEVGRVDRQQRVVLRHPGLVCRIGRVVAQRRVLEQLAQRVDAEAVDPARDPELEHGVHRAPHLGVAPVEVGLLAQVGVVVAALADLLPRAAAEHADPVVGRRAVVPQVPVGPLAEPRVLVRRVVGDVVEDHPQVMTVGGRHQRVEVLERPELRVDRACGR